ncbi:hypothetical protein PYJP_00040 [Pyrofollis japonicus]|uniref:hypothetical protein n=1 Tax=Pyrofollis japonicus TaxID=3060460 RepID=UPI00295AB854|nr:hypothetical protein [Pyrofollis japonicus]BEP16652.1 hypothetical protein PYJP_00040 [Pyrofollis japonicus]
MVYQRYVEEAYTIAQSVAKSCGTTPELEEALKVLDEILAYGGFESDLEYAAMLLRDAADALRQKGCLDWYSLVIAADTLEHAG